MATNKKAAVVKRRSAVGLLLSIFAALWFRLGSIGASDSDYKIRITRIEEQYLIKDLLQRRLQGKVDGLVVYRYEQGRIFPIWTYFSDRQSYKILEFDRINDPELFQQLDLVNCVDRSIARSNGVLLPAIVCPILHQGETVGAIAAFYGALYALPILDSEGIRDPAAGLLYRAGDRVGQSP